MCNNYIRLVVLVSIALTPNISAPPAPGFSAVSSASSGPAGALSPTISLHSRRSRIQPEEAIRRSTQNAWKIVIAMYCLTSEKIVKSLKQAADAGAEITIIADWGQVKHASSRIPELAAYSTNIKVFVVASKTMHLKVMHVEYNDGSTAVLSGSFNYSKSATSHEEEITRNDDPIYCKNMLKRLCVLVTKKTAKPFDRDALEKYKARRESADSDVVVVASSFKGAFSPTRHPRPAPTKPSPSSLPSGPLDASPIPLARAAVLLAQTSLEHDLITYIRNAKKINIVMYSFSSSGMADELIAAHEAGTPVFIIADRLQSLGLTSQIERLRASGIPIFRNKSDMIHCKCFIIESKDEEKMVISGSANVSSRVYDGHNIEQSSCLVGEEVYAKFMQLHDAILKEAEPLRDPIELRTPTLTAARAPEEMSAAHTLTPLADATNTPLARTRKVGSKGALTYDTSKISCIVKPEQEKTKILRSAGALVI